MIRLRVAAAMGAGLLVSTALSPANAQDRVPDGASSLGGGRLVIAELPRIPDGPVCVKDRDWIVVEAEQFIARTTARAEELSRKAVEFELAVDRDAAAGRNAQATREELRETLRRVREAQGYREEARRLTTRDCLVREGQGVDLSTGLASVSGAATATAPQAAEPAIDVRLAQPAPCRADGECAVTLTSETRRPANDDRRVAVLIDLPASAGSFVRSDAAWNCYAMTGGAVCLAKLADLQPGAPTVSSLSWKMQGAAADARFCARTVRTTADGRPSGDPDRMRVLQAVLADYGYRGGTIDGKIDGSRVLLASAAPDFGIERNSDDDHIAAALLGSMVSRVGVTTGPCLQLAMAPANAASATDAPAVSSAAPIGAAVGAAAAAALAATPPRPADPAAPALKSGEPAVQPVKPQPATASVAPEQPSELAKTKAPPPKTTKTTKTKPVKPTVVTRTVEEPEAPAVVVVRPKKRVVVTEDGPAIVVPARPRIVAPPVSIGIGLGRKGGISFGF